MNNKAKAVFRRAAGFIWPELCAGCGRPIEFERSGTDALCEDCFEKWEREKQSERDQYGTFPSFVVNTKTGIGVLYAARYGIDEELIAPEIIYKLKSRATKRMVDFATFELLTMMNRAMPELFDGRIPKKDITVTFIPRRPEAVSDSGFDHMKLCAKRFAGLTGIGFSDLLAHRLNSPEQKLLTAEEREFNIRQSLIFRRGEGQAPTRLTILIDDIITTGSSMRAGIDLLSEHGVEDVLCAALLITNSTN